MPPINDERTYLQELAAKPFSGRIWGYMRLSGPGYMQSALTLGGGSIAACVTFGSILGYELLWVQPVAMILGYFVLAAIAKQVCHTGEKPYSSFWNRLHPAFALLWGGSALISTLIWHFPQYALTANGVTALSQGVGLDLTGTWGSILIGALLLSAAIAVTSMYHSGSRGVKYFERSTQALVWTIVFAFAAVAIATGIDGTRFIRGLLGIDFFQRFMAGEIPPAAVVPIVGGMGAALGINMVFLYPYSLLNKKWGKEHRELAYFDLVSGMVIPFMLATAFMIMAVANTLGPEPGSDGTPLRDVLAVVPVLGPTFGSVVGSVDAGNALALLLIGLGMMAIGFTSIITQMLACGFIGCEMFGFSHDSKAKWWFSLMPAIGVYGVVYGGFPWQAAITASSLNIVFLPITTGCFLVLLLSQSFMGDARPMGWTRIIWTAMLLTSITVMSIAAFFGLRGNIDRLRTEWGGAAESAVPLAPIESTEDVEILIEELDEASAYPSGDDALTPPMGTFSHRAMATEFTITLYGPSPTSTAYDQRLLAEEAFAAIDDLEQRISSWIPSSQISRVNREGHAGPVPVSRDIILLLEASQKYHATTGGAFDVTIGPLMEVFGFYDRAGRMPPDDEVEAARALVGMDKVTVDAAMGTVALAVEGMRIDFGGIGKGYALDVAAEVLRRYGIDHALLSGGTSSMLAIGSPPGRDLWTVGLRNPYNEMEVLETIAFADESFSSSGCYGPMLEVDGMPLCNILDPATGQPVTDRLSVAAIAPTGMESDALSTAFLIMGRDAIESYCRDHPHVSAVYVSAPANGNPVAERINLAQERDMT